MNKLIELSTRLQNNKYFASITQTLITLMPLFMAGAIFTLVSNIGIESYQTFLTSSGLKAILAIPINVTTNIVALYVVFLIGYRLAKEFEQNNPLMFGIIALLAFLVLTPFEINEAFSIEAIPSTWLGGQGMISAFIIGLIIPRIAILLYEKKIIIKMPTGVPANVADSFSAVIPLFVILLITLSLRYGLSLTPFENIHQLIYTIISAPLMFLGGSFPAFIIYVALIHVFWLLGVHGSLVIMMIVMPILTPLGMENMAATNAGQIPPNILTTTFLFQSFGSAAGHTLGLTIAMLFAKSTRYKTIGKLSIIPNIFGINEPVIFGTPIVMNPILGIPFIFVPVVCFIAAYVLSSLGILPHMNGVSLPAGTPIIIGGILSAGWQWGVYQALTIVFSFLCYYPFLRKVDNEEYLIEQSHITMKEEK